VPVLQEANHDCSIKHTAYHSANIPDGTIVWWWSSRCRPRPARSTTIDMRNMMLKYEIIIESDQNKVDINNLLHYALDDMKEKDIITNFQFMVVAEERL
jgi:hypothetical protein